MKPILVLIFILLNQILFAQIQTKVINQGAVIKIELRKEKTPVNLPFFINNLKIIDARNDTSSIGFSSDRNARKFCFKAGFINEMQSWFSQYLKIDGKNPAGHGLLVNIKKIRVSEQATIKQLAMGRKVS